MAVRGRFGGMKDGGVGSMENDGGRVVLMVAFCCWRIWRRSSDVKEFVSSNGSKFAFATFRFL